MAYKEEYMYNKEINVCKIHPKGYLYFCDIMHPLADINGIVYLHRHIMSIHVGRWLESSENVHHKDGDKTNNNIDNLEILSKSDHAHQHKGFRKEATCYLCNKKFMPTTKNQKCCSKECSIIKSRKFNISKDQLKELVWIMPTTKIAELFNVSDKAIEKRCILFNIDKPVRGYWAGKKGL